MEFSSKFYKALGVNNSNVGEVTKLSKVTGISVSRLNYYNENNIVPSGNDLERICYTLKISKNLLMLKMGNLSNEIVESIINNADEIHNTISKQLDSEVRKNKILKSVFQTNLGSLYKGDCLDLMSSIDSDSVDMIFADPPFNLNKLYPSKIDDNLKTEKYLLWCEDWINECARILKHGGSLFVWNLPKWNKIISNFLDSRLSFRHWIAADIKFGLPISNRLYPSHYSLLYYVKGDKPNTFHPDRLPMQVCSSCFGDLKDYGGYKDKMNPNGINLTDVWYDIPPVRHAKYKKRNGANELSIKLLDRIIEMSTDEGDIVFDPFGGSGTTYVVSEIKKRKWIGCEIGPIEDIIARFNNLEEERNNLKNYRKDLNHLFPQRIKKERNKKGLWTDETVRKHGVLN